MPVDAKSPPSESGARLESRRTQRVARTARQLLWLSVVVVVAAGLTMFWRSKGRQLFGRWQQGRDLQHAELALAEKQYPQAADLARRVALEDSSSLRAARTAALALEQLGSPEAVRWWHRTAQLEQFPAETVARWAYAAFRQNDLPATYAALRMFPRGTDSVSYHDIAGRIALTQGDFVTAAGHFSNALAHSSADPDLQLQAATTALATTNATAHPRARQLLQGLLADPQRSTPALAALTRDALRTGDTTAARRFNEQLLARPNATFADRLVQLSVLRRGQAPEFPAEFARLRDGVANNSEQLAQWLAWMIEEGLAAEALAWFLTLPPEAQNVAPVMSQAAELYVALSDWAGLRQWVFNANWAELESRRFAYQALATLKLTPKAGPQTIDSPWKDAINSARSNPLQLGWLAAKADEWSLPRAAEVTLWLMVDRDYDADNSLERLARLYRGLRQAEGLYRVARRRLERYPADPVAQSEVVYLAALLRVDLDERRKLATQVEARAAEAPEYATSAALYRCRLQNPDRALELLRTISKEDLQEPARMALHSLLLAQVGDRASARELLLQLKEADLFPEEKKLVDDARVLARAR